MPNGTEGGHFQHSLVTHRANVSYNICEMYNKICILGRQSELSLAELESLLGQANVQPFGDHVALVQDTEKRLNQDYLGGTIKVGMLIKEIGGADFNAAIEQLKEWLDSYVPPLGEGKFNFGISFYRLPISSKRLQAVGLELKKYIKTLHSSVRLVTSNKGTELSSAQIIHNDLTGPMGVELLIASNGAKTLIAKTISIQDIESYTSRDFYRPRRDMVVGMLPPKLAQIMLNLAEAEPQSPVLDPFCGTGVVLMEAALRGCRLQGTDLKPKMIEYTKINLDWLSKHYSQSEKEAVLAVGDAQTFRWEKPIGHVVTELYLGPPLTSAPERVKLNSIVEECNTLATKFLTNLVSQLDKGVHCTIAVPAWNTPDGIRHLPLIDHLSEMGYNQHSFSHVDNRGLLYYRSDQVVARELVIVSKR